MFTSFLGFIYPLRNCLGLMVVAALSANTHALLASSVHDTLSVRFIEANLCFLCLLSVSTPSSGLRCQYDMQCLLSDCCVSDRKSLGRLFLHPWTTITLQQDYLAPHADSYLTSCGRHEATEHKCRLISEGRGYLFNKSAINTSEFRHQRSDCTSHR